MEGSYWSAVHTADALRLLMVYKFGGFYLDLDHVVLNDLNHYNNMVLGKEEYVLFNNNFLPNIFHGPFRTEGTWAR